jgi:hypothetical protein
MEAGKKAFLTKVLGEDLVEQLIANAQAKTLELEEEGVRYKTQRNPVAPYVAMVRASLTPRTALKSAELTKQIAALERSDTPAAPYAAELLRSLTRS